MENNLYNFKRIQVVPAAADFIDIVLSKCNKGVTVVHPGYAISRIRAFYMRKVKFCQQCFHDKLTKILEDFPLLDDIHPFYADLMNVLYDRDHYKLALGQLNIARRLIDNLAKDYVRLLKFGTSLYQCKQLKRAALGRMCTLMKKLKASLVYLEQVRQHLSRLPSIDPTTRTLILCGYPNVGKSSFINSLTRANVDVQPYAFTTKSLFVGHMDYQYLRWQVIDTPGLLDHPLEDRNTIEMQSITALAHLHAAVVYIVDISEQCGYTIHQQVELFRSIKPLFANKPVMLVANKVDTKKFEDLTDEDKALMDAAGKEAGAPGMLMSTMTGEGVSEVKIAACDRLLEKRVNIKMRGKRMVEVRNRLEVTVPKPRDGRQRPAYIPEAVLANRNVQAMAEEDGEDGAQDRKEEAGVAAAGAPPKSIFEGTPHYSRNWVEMGPYDQQKDPLFLFGPEWKEQYMLREDEHKWDRIPEIMNGMNVADYYVEDVDDAVEALEREEEDRIMALEKALAEGSWDDHDLTEEDRQALAEWKKKKSKILFDHRSKKIRNPGLSRRQSAPLDTVQDMEDHLESIGIDAKRASARLRAKSRGRPKSRDRSASRGPQDGDVTMERSVSRSRKRTRSELRGVSPSPGVASEQMLRQAVKRSRKSQEKRNRNARAGEADRSITTKMPKHLFSGKRGQQADRR